MQSLPRGSIDRNGVRVSHSKMYIRFNKIALLWFKLYYLFVDRVKRKKIIWAGKTGT